MDFEFSNIENTLTLDLNIDIKIPVSVTIWGHEGEISILVKFE
jgi:hypothetical protein